MPSASKTDAAGSAAGRVRLTVRASMAQNAVLRRAAAAAGTSVSAFVAEAAAAEAVRRLSGPPGDADWALAAALLSRPAEDAGRLKELLVGPA